MKTPFTRLISQLLQSYNLKQASGQTDSDATVYTINVDQAIEIHLIGEQQGYLNMVCYLPVSKAALKEAHLLTLLNLNDFSLDHPRFCIGLSENQAFTLSVRQPLHELNASELYQLMTVFIERANFLKDFLNSRS